MQTNPSNVVTKHACGRLRRHATLFCTKASVQPGLLSHKGQRKTEAPHIPRPCKLFGTDGPAFVKATALQDARQRFARHTWIHISIFVLGVPRCDWNTEKRTADNVSPDNHEPTFRSMLLQDGGRVLVLLVLGNNSVHVASCLGDLCPHRCTNEKQWRARRPTCRNLNRTDREV